MLASCVNVLRSSSTPFLRQYVPTVHQIRNIVLSDDDDEKKKLKALGNKARVIALKTSKLSKKGDKSKLLKKVQDKRTFEVHEQMSVNDISILTGAPKDTLLDVVLSHVSLAYKKEDELNVEFYIMYFVSKYVLRECENTTLTVSISVCIFANKASVNPL